MGKATPARKFGSSDLESRAISTWGQDSNLRLPGSEPGVLPLNYPTMRANRRRTG